VDESVVYDEHARDRMRERQIPEAAVLAVLKNFDIRRPAPTRPGRPACIIYEGEYEGRRLKVYVRADSNPPYVVTVVWKGESAQ